MKNFETLIFTATYNEAENISNFLNQIILLNLKSDVLIIDDNSPDQTFEILNKFSKKYKFINYKKRSGKLGLDTAHKEAYLYAKENNYKKFISLDADLSHNPIYIKDFIDLLEKYPFIIGSRYMKGGKNNMSFLRLALSFIGNQIIKRALNLPNTEFTSSFRGFNLEKLNNFDLKIVNSKGYSFFMETIYQLDRLGIYIKEIPIVFEDRKKGISKIPKIEIFRTLKNVFILLIKKFI